MPYLLTNQQSDQATNILDSQHQPALANSKLTPKEAAAAAAVAVAAAAAAANQSLNLSLKRQQLEVQQQQQAIGGDALSAASMSLASNQSAAAAAQQQAGGGGVGANNSIQSSPILVSKSASSSSVLSSVSLASGAQMKQPALQQQRVTLAESAPAAADQQQVAASDLATTTTNDNQRLEKGRGEDNRLAPNKDSDQEQTENNNNSGPVAVARDPQIQTPKPQINELKRLLRHTNSLCQLPEFGVETEEAEQLGELMEQIDVWGLNIFEVHKFSQQHSLTAVMYKIFKVSSTARTLDTFCSKQIH